MADDPLSIESLSQVPEVRRALAALGKRPERELSDEGLALLLAIRDATLAALARQPEEAVVEEAAKAMYFGRYAPIGGDWELNETKEVWHQYVRTALPILIAGEVARREEAERESREDEARTVCVCGYEKRHHNEDGTAHLMGSEEPCDFCPEIVERIVVRQPPYLREVAKREAVERERDEMQEENALLTVEVARLEMVRHTAEAEVTRLRAALGRTLESLRTIAHLLQNPADAGHLIHGGNAFKLARDAYIAESSVMGGGESSLLGGAK